MMIQNRSKTKTATRLARDCCTSLLLSILATSVYATQHVIDMTSCNASPPPAASFVSIPALVSNLLDDTIVAQDGMGNPVSATWVFDEAPPLACGSGPFVCNDIAIDLPTAMPSTDPVTLLGTPLDGGIFSFILEVTDGSTTCFEGYELVITRLYDLVFVIDRSGSMTLDADPSNPGPIRIS